MSNKWFKENGFLSEEGNGLLLDFRTALDNIMESDDIHDMSDNELLILQSNMTKLVGDAIAKQLSHRQVRSAKIEAMTDEEFDAYLHDKYGDSWFVHGLEPEELARAKRIAYVNVEKAFAEMQAVAAHVMKARDRALELEREGLPVEAQRQDGAIDRLLRPFDVAELTADARELERCRHVPDHARRWPPARREAGARGARDCTRQPGSAVDRRRAPPRHRRPRQRARLLRAGGDRRASRAPHRGSGAAGRCPRARLPARRRGPGSRAPRGSRRA